MWFGMGRVPDGGYGCLLHGNVRDKEEFHRAFIFNLDHEVPQADLVQLSFVFHEYLSAKRWYQGVEGSG
jgi:hypothetical protein